MKTMNKMNKRTLITILWICVIWGHSLMPCTISSEESGTIFLFLQSIFPFLTHHLVRKMGHFTEYCILGILMEKHREIPPVIICWMVAFLDETIQIFSAERGPAITDVWIDVAGACLGIVIHMIWRRIRNEARV